MNYFDSYYRWEWVILGPPPAPPKEGRADEQQVSLHVIWLPPLSEGLGVAS